MVSKLDQANNPNTDWASWSQTFLDGPNRPLTRAEEKACLQQWKYGGDVTAKEILFYANMGIVQKVVKKFNTVDSSYSLYTKEDLRNEAYLGFERALEKFDVGKNTRLSTYLEFWLVKYIYEFIVRNSSAINLSDNAFQQIRAYSNLLQDCEMNCKIMTDEEMSEELDMSVAVIRNVRAVHQLTSNTFSIDDDTTIKSNHSSVSISEAIPDARINIEEETIGRVELELLQKGLEQLSQTERKVIEYRILDTPCSVTKASRTLGLLPREVKIAEKNALQKLRNYLEGIAPKHPLSNMD